MEGTRLGPYSLGAELGAGGMGRVYAATVTGRSPGLAEGTRVAVKIVHPHLLETPGFFKRFLREAEIGKSVRHENVVATYDCDAVAAGGTQHHFLVMEFVEGRTLRRLIEELGRVPEQLCRHVGREIAKGLAAIHAAGVVHRDLKPENVLITGENAVKVMDLGLARLADEQLRLSQSGHFVGTVPYAAPEQFRGGDVDARADLHALGVILYELATAQHPFEADDFRRTMRRVLDETPRRCAEINPQLSPCFEEVIHTLLAKEADARFADAAILLRVLEEGEASAWWKERARTIVAATRRPLRRIRIPRETALYGRDAELAKLSALFARAEAGEGQVVLVEGEAGIGKSRLVDEWVVLLHQQGHDVNFLFGSYPPGGAATPTGAFSTAYRAQFGESGCAAWLKETPILVPAFDALLRGEPAPSGVEPLTKESLQTVFLHATRNLAAERPTIVLIDDLHFAPEEGRALFSALATAVRDLRVLLVGTARPGLDVKWIDELERSGASRLPLQRLGAKDLVRLLAETLGSEHVALELAGKLALKSDGNPFFAFEILRGLRDGHFLAKDASGAWVTTRVIDELLIPSSVLDLVNARVADLDDDDRNLLDVASCIGFDFDPLLAGVVLGMAKIPLLQRLAKIEKRHRLVRSAGATFVFDHHQVQEALYGAIPELLRAEYHAGIAGALESQSGAADGDAMAVDGALAVSLAGHFLDGNDGRRALRYLPAALDHLESNYLNEAAIALAGRALEVPGLVQGRERADLLRRVVWRLVICGRHDAERTAIDELVALADESGDPVLRSQAAQAHGDHLSRTSGYGEAEVLFRRAMDLSREAGDLPGEASAAHSLSGICWLTGRLDEAQALSERSLAIGRELGNPRKECGALLYLGVVCAFRGAVDESNGFYERCIAIARLAGDCRYAELAATTNLGNNLVSRGDAQRARDLHERVLAGWREIGSRSGEAGVNGCLGGDYEHMGCLAPAVAHRERHLALARECGDRRLMATAHQSLASLGISLGDRDGARAHLEACRASAPDASSMESYVRSYAANLAAEEDDFATAEHELREFLSEGRARGDHMRIAAGLLLLGRLLVVTGRRDEAAEALRECVATAREPGRDGYVLEARASLASLGQDDALAVAELLGVHGALLTVANRMDVRHLLWRATGDRAHINEAKRLLDHLVANAPPECRTPMLTNVRLHRAVAAAWSMNDTLPG